jgi:hypothetical protein
VYPAALAYSHDMWLLPDRFVLDERETLVVRQFVGTELNSGEELPLLRRMTRRFELVTPDARVDLLAALPRERFDALCDAAFAELEGVA